MDARHARSGGGFVINRTRVLAAATALVGVVGIGAVACTAAESDKPRTATVERATLTTGVSAPGALTAITEQNLGFPKGGQLTSVLVKVGDRVELDLTLMKTRTVCTDYGDMHIYVFEDDAGNVLVWKTSTIMMFVTENDEQTFKPGDRLRLRATIKDHDEYNNIKQTVLARGKALAVLG